MTEQGKPKRQRVAKTNEDRIAAILEPQRRKVDKLRLKVDGLKTELSWASKQHLSELDELNRLERALGAVAKEAAQ